MTKPIQILALTKYARLGASSRIRILQYRPFLKKEGIEVDEQPLVDDELLRLRYHLGFYKTTALAKAYAKRFRNLLTCRKFDIVWIEKEALPWCPLLIERILLHGVPYVLDYDDAVFHNYDQHASIWVRRVYGRRLDGLMARSAMVICGNSYLAMRAKSAGAPWVEVVPSVIDLSHYPKPTKRKAVHNNSDPLPRIVWVGSPTTVHYLDLILDALQTVARQYPFVLRIIGGGKPDLPGVTVEAVTWSEKTEAENIRNCVLGVMPLHDSSWERGKCGYKLIQYMACSLPVIASAVGVNPDIVKSGENGFLATNTDDWVTAMQRLLSDPLLCARMGESGRRRVEQTYCTQQAGPVVARFFQKVVEMHR